MGFRLLDSAPGQAFASAAAFFFLLLGALLWLSGGHFAYVIDDPYIHLALAENLPFNYSINAVGDEAGAPSSSILYPYLLMPLAQTPLAAFAPLLLNVAAGAGVLLVLLRLVARRWPQAPHGLAAFGFAVLLNVFGMMFTGMEHTLHLLLTLLLLLGLLEAEEGQAPRWWLWAALMLAPFIRYEGLALSLAACVYLAGRGYVARAVWALLAVLAGLAAFSFYLHSLGYSWLPSSVLSKSAPLTTASEGMSWLMSLAALLFNCALNFNEPTTWAHVLVLGLVVYAAVRGGPARNLLWVAAFGGAAHLLLGKFGWFGRYHPYILAFMLFSLFQAWRGLSGVRAAALVLAAGIPALIYTAIVPPAGAQIYRYHGTLHDFLVRDWQDKVAAYDIGYIAWQNPHAVVDLFGLGSERVRRIIRQPDAPEHIAALLKAEGVDLVLAEKSVMGFYGTPDWVLGGELILSGRQWMTGLNPRFYLTSPRRLPELRTKLEALRPHLPEGVELRVY